MPAFMIDYKPFRGHTREEAEEYAETIDEALEQFREEHPDAKVYGIECVEDRDL